ncbi:SDR family NAD(P)-dependent oxidoreductase [Streptomyces sp. NPDC014986]|uniref:SDR family NAD(P)-dependent oxidoreductase n=1 Tax=Streptomyces sp. NPDC014986 TaxID=3364934 RepID=UPI0036F58E95
MTDSPFDLTGRVVWVTGAGKGLGRAMAVALSRAGARVAVSSRTADDLKGLAAELAAEGGQIDVHPLSVADPDAVRVTAEAVIERAGRLDGLVNCAGISPDFTRSERLDDATWSRILDVNLSGTFYCCREAGRIMLERGGGSIVNVSSVHATAGFGRLAAYSASKGAVEALTRTLAVEWAERGVRVNTLAPGYFDTELSKPLMSNDSWADRVKSAIPMARTGDPDELSGAVVFLMSDASRYTTGSTLTVDGGWTAW